MVLPTDATMILPTDATMVKPIDATMILPSDTTMVLPTEDGSDHTGSTTTEFHEKEADTLAFKETKAVYAGKVLVFGVLIAAAVTMGSVTHWFTSKDEQEMFESQVGCHWLPLLSGVDLHRTTNTSGLVIYLTTTV
jgi:hypothetical protein